MTQTVAFIFAHPDDETFSAACLIHEIKRRGGTSVLQSATRGDAGKTGFLAPMSKEALAELREKELLQAGEIMGLNTIEHLGYPDGKLSEVPRVELVQAIADFINKHQASIVITFPADGISGHADHIAIHHAVNEVIASGQCPSVQKVYYCTPADEAHRADVSVQLDVTSDWEMKARALRAHESQMLSINRVFGDLTILPALKMMRYESFTLVWENGIPVPPIQQESFIF